MMVGLAGFRCGARYRRMQVYVCAD